MTRFSASDAALEGFRLTRERPGTVLAWAGVYFVTMLGIGALMLGLLGPNLLQRLKDGALNDPQALAGALGQSSPALIVCLVLVIGLMSVLTAGIYRIILRPDEGGFMHLRLGMDELRITIINIVLFTVGIFCLAFALAVAALAATVNPLAEVVAGAGGVVLTLWVGVRLSMATPMTFVTRRLALRDAWLLSRGSFWPLLSMMALAVIFYVIVYLLITIIAVGVTAAAGGPDAMDLANFAPGALLAKGLNFVLQAVLWVLQVAMIYAPFAVAYEQLHGDLSVDPLRRTPRAQTP